MNSRQAEIDILPKFRNAPVTEVSLAVAYAPIAGLNAGAMGRLWTQHFAGELPRVEEMPPYLPTVERFGPAASLLPQFNFALCTGSPGVRLWLLSEQGTELAQLQRDWFARNWRRVADQADPYPHYDHVRHAFEDNLETLKRFLVAQHLGALQPTQAEVTYVNHIRRENLWSAHTDIERVFKFWSAPPAAAPLEDAQVQMRFTIPGAGPTPAGRLYVSVQPAFLSGGEEPIFVMTLIARVGTGADGDILGALDVGHSWVVHRFAELTTDAAHTTWERYA